MVSRSTAKRCKKNVKELAKGVDEMHRSMTPEGLEQVERLGLSFVELLPQAAPGLGAPPEGEWFGDTRHRRSDSGAVEIYSTPKHTSPRKTPKHRSKPVEPGDDLDEQWFQGPGVGEPAMALPQ